MKENYKEESEKQDIMHKKTVDRKDKSYQRLKDRLDLVKIEVENKEA